MARKRVYTERALKDERDEELAAIAKAFAGFRPAHEVLVAVRAVPTIFVQFDHGTKVGGLPIERITLVHGPSAGGKTSWTLGLIRSFLERGHPTFFVDAERTTPDNFVRITVGEHASSPIFFARRPESYEATVAEVQEFCNRIRVLRDEGKIGKDRVGLIVVDSIRKLVPKQQWKEIQELAKVGKEVGEREVKNRIAQIKALMNAAWCDMLIPLLELSGCAMVIIARETEDGDAPPIKTRFGTTIKQVKTGGGSALYYDASLDVRVELAGYVYKSKSDGEERPTVYGERHRITIKKSKVSGKEDRTIVCHFHMSNGLLVPEGFDRARDLVEMGRRLGVIKGGEKGTSMAWGRHRWRGDNAAVRKLHDEPSLLGELEAQVRARFAAREPLEAGA